MKMVATITIDAAPSADAVAVAEACHAAYEAWKAEFDAGGTPRYPESFADSAAWKRSEEAKLASSVAKMQASMKGWRQSRTDVGIFWSGVGGWVHQYQTYWTKDV